MDRVDEIFLSDTRDVNAHVARSCPSYPAMQPQPRRLRWSRAGNHSNHSSPGATQHCNIAIGAITAIALSFIGSRRTSLRHPHYRRLLFVLCYLPQKSLVDVCPHPSFAPAHRSWSGSFVEQFVRGQEPSSTKLPCSS